MNKKLRTLLALVLTALLAISLYVGTEKKLR